MALSVLKEVYQAQQFAPRWWAAAFHPFYFARRSLHAVMKTHAPQVTGRVLDVGCGQKPYWPLFSNAQAMVGLEYDTPENRASKRADAFYDGNSFPFEAASFDTLICNQVLEHVFNPQQFVQEMARVLKRDGKLVLTVPFVWDEHEQPYDYARYSSFGLTHLLNSNGFEVVSHTKTCADVSVLFQLTNAYLYKSLLANRGPLASLLFSTLFCGPVNFVGQFFLKLLPKNNDLFLDNVILARKK